MNRIWSIIFAVAIILVAIYFYPQLDTLTYVIVITILIILFVIFLIKNKINNATDTLPNTKFTYEK